MNTSMRSHLNEQITLQASSHRGCWIYKGITDSYHLLHGHTKLERVVLVQ